jgi:hypothetical protein
MATVMQDTRTVSGDRIFYTGMALLAAATVLIGFSPTFFLRPAAVPPLSPLLVTHGVFFSAWIALLIVQTTLIAANRRDVHRKVGLFGAGLAAVMVLLGTLAAIDAMRRGRAPVEGLDPRSFFAIPMRDMVTFPLLVGAALWFRRDTEMHKRLMVLAAISVLDAAIARFPLAAIAQYGPPVFFGIQDLMVLTGPAYDFLTRGRVHRAYLWGGALLILTQPLFLAISGTRPWLAFADWLLR